MSHPQPRKGGAASSSFINTALKSKGLEIHTLLEDPPHLYTSFEEQPVSSGSFHRQIAASIMQHHPCVERARRSAQPVSPASYSSSMELTPYNAAATPTRSLDYKGFGLKTSTELLKVLNRIWCLEEQHGWYISLVKSLKTDVDNARMRIKQLLQEKQMDCQVIDGLMNEIGEHDRVQSMREEKKLRKRFESLHRKLAREISELKCSLESERRARVLLEDLCDEFATGIGRHDAEQVQNSLVLHMSELWLDERMQMKLAEETYKNNVDEKGMIVDKLRPQILTFLKARHASHYLGGIINMPMKVPQYDHEEDDDDDSIDSDTNCFELSNGTHAENDQSISSLPARFEKHMVLTPRLPEPQMIRMVGNESRTNSSSRIHPGSGLADDDVSLEPKLVSKDSGNPQCSSRWARGSTKENTLKAKLIEARLQGQKKLSF